MSQLTPVLEVAVCKDFDIARRARWVKPELVAEVACAEVTPDGGLRHPSFEGMREDKRAGQV
ncbi:hypothetical protein LGH82_05420 [Mesorhizobium sp. PAMC28654]|uniref:ATP dependent DNA ligase n=1 Tax=Mesorhizobium sp. PAMC28654 TaxID=2880934 RepID=UPI001D09F5DD|nr:hypothetical protein [Mesorhizobium sp. PAMC28654]UDL90755.1 hypothetical protein LGH82_05420 [Mesorhizobium sp. PAMC28654]